MCIVETVPSYLSHLQLTSNSSMRVITLTNRITMIHLHTTDCTAEFDLGLTNNRSHPNIITAAGDTTRFLLPAKSLPSFALFFPL